MKFKKSLLILFTSLALVACSSGGGDSSSSVTPPASSTSDSSSSGTSESSSTSEESGTSSSSTSESSSEASESTSSSQESESSESSESSSESSESSSEESESSSSVHEHTYSDEWSHDAENHWHAATCGHDVESDLAPHTWGETTVTTDPTCTEAGEGTHACTVCGYEETVVIDALGHDVDGSGSCTRGDLNILGDMSTQTGIINWTGTDETTGIDNYTLVYDLEIGSTVEFVAASGCITAPDQAYLDAISLVYDETAISVAISFRENATEESPDLTGNVVFTVTGVSPAEGELVIGGKFNVSYQTVMKNGGNAGIDDGTGDDF